MRHVHLDFETRGFVDIRKVGAAVYAQDEQTSIICFAYTIPEAPDEDPVLATPHQIFRSGILKSRFKEIIDDDDIIFVAHNAAFERNVWKQKMVPIGYPDIPIHRWKCTMAKAYAHGLPGGLDQAVKAMELGIEKDLEGAKIMEKLSRPVPVNKRKNGKLFWEYDDCPEDFQKLYEYCKQDVRVERALDASLRDLSPTETKLWYIDQRINQTGIRLDVPLVKKAIEIGDAHKAHLQEQFEQNTGYLVGKPTQRGVLKDWLNSEGLDITNTRKSTLDLLDRDDIPEHVAKTIDIIGEYNKTSLAKYQAMLRRMDDDGILREIYQYHGAHTGRWAGRGVQLQNLPRPKVDSDTFLDLLSSLSYEGIRCLYEDVNTALSSGIRGVLIPRDGCQFFCGDFAQMEARVLAWLAGEQYVLDMFRQKVDTYCAAASIIYGREIDKEVDKDERQVGKVSELALGFGGGIAAYAKMAIGYGVDLASIAGFVWASANSIERDSALHHYQMYLKRREDDDADGLPVSPIVGWASDVIKQRWRASRPITVDYWERLEKTAIDCVVSQKPQRCGTGLWFMHDRFLIRKLASGRAMAYPYPKVAIKKNGAKTLSYRRVDPITKKWVRHTTYGGQLAENETQAVQRDLMIQPMLELEEIYPVIMHTHDELLSEVRIGEGDLEQFRDIMKRPNSWSGTYESGIPIDVDVWAGMRYRK